MKRWLWIVVIVAVGVAAVPAVLYYRSVTEIGNSVIRVQELDSQPESFFLLTDEILANLSADVRAVFIQAFERGDAQGVFRDDVVAENHRMLAAESNSQVGRTETQFEYRDAFYVYTIGLP